MFKYLLTSRRLTMGFVLVILWSTLIYQGASNFSWPNIDKVFHVLAFAILVFPRTYRKPRRWWRYALLALVLGGLIELAQPYFGRSKDWDDFIADGVGIAIGVVAAVVVRRARHARVTEGHMAK